LSGCSGCTDGHGASDAGTDTSTADGDTDTDSDGDTDTDTLPEGFVPDAGPWDWEDLPDAGDCGQPGCRQLTFTDEVDVLEWDVWGNLLAFTDGITTETRLVDYSSSRQLLLPNPYTDYPVGPALSAINLFPATIYEQVVCYSKLAGSGAQIFSAIVCADIENMTQNPVSHRPMQGDDFPNPANYIDVYGTRIVSMGGCGEVMDSWPLCAFDMESPGTYQEIAPHYYGSHNSMWGDIVVWYSEIGGYDIRGYDFSTGEDFDVVADDEVQFNPRIHGNRVVYQDLRFGDGGTPQTSWAHSAVFMHDLASHETTQITSGEWIAADPDVHENIVVWADYRDSAAPNDANSFSGVEIWGYNLDTETEFQITDLPGRSKTTPRIWGDKVFVHMYKTTPGQDAIYMFDLPDGAR
jgi:hypothetical protein